MGRMSEEKIFNSILKGIENAQRDCNTGSNSLLRQAPEYFTTVNIYQSLLELFETDFLGSEMKPKDIRGKKRGRIAKGLRCNGRCDLVLWSAKSDKVSVAIEVKKDVQSCYLNDDIERLIHLVKNDSLDYAISASVIYQKLGPSSNKNARDKIECILNDKKTEVERLAIRKSNGILRVKMIRNNLHEIQLNKYEDGSFENWLW